MRPAQGRSAERIAATPPRPHRLWRPRLQARRYSPRRTGATATPKPGDGESRGVGGRDPGEQPPVRRRSCRAPIALALLSMLIDASHQRHLGRGIAPSFASTPTVLLLSKVAHALGNLPVVGILITTVGVLYVLLAVRLPLKAVRT